MSKTILLVDDEMQLLSLLSEVLQKEGFKVFTARNGEEALNQARYVRPDLIILDIMMSKMDGFEFISRYGRESDTPIIVLSAKVDEMDKILGLKLGADDYVPKPFSPRELLARIEAVLRRIEFQASRAEILRVGDISLDHQTHEFKVCGQTINLTRTEFDLLACLMVSPGRVFSRAELLEKTQGAVIEGFERTIDVHIKNLRSKIEPNPTKPVYIETVYGIGYRFNNPVAS